MEVNGPTSIPGTIRIDTATRPAEAHRATEAKTATPQDEVEISTAGKMLQNMSESGELRSERLAGIKAAIEAGTYETPEKLEAALERMMGEIGLGEED